MNAPMYETFRSVGLLILRVGAGGLLATHGWGKVQMIVGRQFDQFGDPIGLGSGLSLVLVAFAEFLCSLLVIAGLLTRLAAVPVVFTMAVAAFVVHRADPLMMTGQGGAKEPALLFLIPFLALIFTGPGRFSVDAILWGRRRGTPAGRGGSATRIE